MLARANSDAGTRLRRSKSTSTVHKRPTSVTDSLDLDAVKQQALAAATAAFARAQLQDVADHSGKRNSEVSRSKSNTSRKSLMSQGSHFPPRESSLRSTQRPKVQENTRSQFRSQASEADTEQNTEQFPPFYPTPTVEGSSPPPRQLSTQPSITFSESARPSSQPKPLRPNASTSITSQQIRKARSMYYASSVQTGSPIARPPAKYLTTPPTVGIIPISEPSPVYVPNRTLGPSPLAGPRLPVTVGLDATLDKARDDYLQGFQQKAIKHKPSIQHTPDDSTTDLTLNDFVPPQDIKEKRSFSGSLKSKIRKVFRRTSAKSANLPVQQIDASRDYFHTARIGPPSVDETYAIPPPDQETLQRIRARTPSSEGNRPVYLRSGSRSNSTGSGRSNRSLHSEVHVPHVPTSRVTSWGTSSTEDTLTQRAMKRMTVIHESKDSIGSEADRIASAIAVRRKSMPLPPLASFRDPMPMESLVEEVPTPIDAKRVFSALMREMGTSKPSQTSAGLIEGTPGAESDVFESSTTKLQVQTRELHSSCSRHLRSSTELEQRPPSRRPATAQSTQSKTSTIKSLGRAIRSTIRTVTPRQHSSPDPDVTANVDDANNINKHDENTPSNVATSDSEDGGDTSDDADKDHTTQIFTPSASQIEKRVERAKDRWNNSLDEAEHLQFPRETSKIYDITTFDQQTRKTQQSSVEGSQAASLDTGTVQTQIAHGLPESPKVQGSPVPQASMTPMSPSIYSRNTDGVSILPNDSVMSFNGPNDLDRSHDGGSAVILTSHSVRSYVVGTPSPRQRGPDCASRDWRAWLSHEISGMELTSQEDLRIDDQYTTPSKRGQDSAGTSFTEQDDTTVVLQASHNTNTPRADIEPIASIKVPHVDDDQPDLDHQPQNGALGGTPVSKGHKPRIDSLKEDAVSYSPTVRAYGSIESRRKSQIGSARLSNAESSPSISRCRVSTSRLGFETPKSPAMNDRFPFLDTGRRSSSNSLCSRNSKSATESVASLKSLKSFKSTPGARLNADISAPSTDETSRRAPTTALKRSDAQLKRKENITPPISRDQRQPAASPLGVTPRTNSQQLLCSSPLNRNSSYADQNIAKTPEMNATKLQQDPNATPLRPRVRVKMRPVSPEKLARRPRSAFDLRGTNGLGGLNAAPQHASAGVRQPTLHVKTSSSSLAMTKEPIPDALERVIDSVIDGDRSGSVTPGQRMADRFLKEREKTPVPEGSVGKRGGLVLVREDTPAFL
ncbi:hypothetical protein Alg130_04449 [Pyrenophora tritici-repentis]|nr:hypothetical protein Alg130_04449 [Pyrenophora tritici-repentis]KAI0612298.1 hypothetical protein TUN205_03464 [Pyrenophora tritici-repentis]